MASHPQLNTKDLLKIVSLDIQFLWPGPVPSHCFIIDRKKRITSLDMPSFLIKIDAKCTFKKGIYTFFFLLKQCVRDEYQYFLLFPTISHLCFAKAFMDFFTTSK